ncbi:CocE/NonD family hydrolase [uncultured Paenalcaligenes sp.]|uniref:alpha/beta hydrolase n=1 Tax=uncultured Paenalcaligenes sp. TaxID=1588925 RepID=UPI00262D6B3E|nr:CocE/NonD family hydrolase [uncultured Paenalcaligenes sp.]
MERIKTAQYQGKAGVIDCAIDWPEANQPITGWALILHPHPLHGGARNNKVVTTMSRAATLHGLVALRPDFRGVGASEGEFNHGHGETLDMIEVVQQFQAQFSEICSGHFMLGGFSFGTSVAAQLYATLASTGQRTPQALVLAGCAVERFRFVDELRVPNHTYLVHGEADEVVPLSESMAFAKTHDLAVSVIPETGHFFHGKLILLRELVSAQWQLGMLRQA